MDPLQKGDSNCSHPMFPLGANATVLLGVCTVLLGVPGQGFGSQEWDCRGGFCEKRSGAALCQTQSVPASSTTNPLQARAETISEAGGASTKAYLRKGKTTHGREE